MHRLADARQPDLPADEGVLSLSEKRHAAALHACQSRRRDRRSRAVPRSGRTVALARDARILRAPAAEEADHLAWCESRLRELGSRPSWLNPLWYLSSFGLGAAAAVLGDAVSLGLVTETETQVEGHLDSHLDRLPAADLRSRKIVEIMKSEEAGHGQAARARGATELPAPIPSLMRMAARVMTGSSYWL